MTTATGRRNPEAGNRVYKPSGETLNGGYTDRRPSR